MPRLFYHFQGLYWCQKFPIYLVMSPTLGNFEKMALKNKYLHIPASMDLSKLLKIGYFEKLYFSTNFLRLLLFLGYLSDRPEIVI